MVLFVLTEDSESATIIVRQLTGGMKNGEHMSKYLCFMRCGGKERDTREDYVCFR